MLSSGEPALDPAQARKAIPYWDEVFKGELAKSAVWLSSTRGEEVTAAVWRAITLVIYRGRPVDEAVAGLRGEIGRIFP
jgi:hypothetical protein